MPGSRPGLRPLPERADDLSELLAMVARGDEAAFEVAYDRLARPVYGLIRKVVRDPAQSEEVAQEVLLEVWRTAAAVTRQLAPEVSQAAPARQRRSLWRRGQVRPARLRPARGPWLPRLAAAVTAAAVAAAVALGVIQSSTQHRLDQAQAASRSIAAVLAAPDARLTVHRTTAGGVATVVASRSRHALIISTAGLPALHGGKVYELWFLSGQTARRAGLLPAPAAGRTAPLLASGLAAGDAVALTVEPAGGTSHPTTKPIVVVPL